MNNLPQKLNALRTEQGLSLRECATRAGVAASYLAKLEAGQASPTVMTLNKVLEALGADLSEFFAAPDAEVERGPLICRREEMSVLEDTERKWLFAFPHRSDLDLILSHEEYQPHTSEIARERHHGDFCGLVLSGELTLEGAESRTMVAKAGDAFYIPAGESHVARNDGDTVLRMVVVGQRHMSRGQLGGKQRK